MSIFDPQDPTEGNRRRQALVQRLMGQLGGGQRGGGPVGAGAQSGAFKPLQSLGGLRAFRNMAGLARAPMPRITAPMNLSPQMARLLGPGGAGVPAAGEYSTAPGQPVPTPPATPYNPSAGGNRFMDLAPPPSGGENPMAPQGPYPNQDPSQFQGVPPPESWNLIPPPAPMQDPSTFSGYVPLGGGAYFDPRDEAIRGGAGVRATGSGVRTARASWWD